MQALDSSASSIGGTGDTLSLTEKILSARFTPFVVSGIFVALLLAWSRLDFSIPTHDAANHSNYSSLVEQWLCRPKGWNLDSLRSILTLMPNYPAGGWFFNAICKIIVGNSRFGEQIILALHLLILNFAVWKSCMFLLKNRAQAALSLIFLDCCPIILVLQHSPLLDLQQTALFMLFFWCLLCWWQNQSWKNTWPLALLFGFYCVTKQTSILYSAPSLCVAGLISLYQKRFASVAQLGVVALSAALMLLTWVLPNWTYLFSYSQERGSFASQHMGVLSSIFFDIKESLFLIVQGLSLPLAVMLVAMALARKIRVGDLKSLSPLLLSSFAGTILISILAYYNAPEARYYAPSVVALCVLLAAAAANLLRSSRLGEYAVVAALLASFVQALLLCFQPLPPASSAPLMLERPQNYISGVREVNMLEHLAYVPKGDAWKQLWIFDVIEAADPGRSVYLNVLSNSKPFNLGTLAFVAKLRKSKVKVTIWRGIGANITDTFAYTDESLRCMQWILEKTGDENVPFFNSSSHDSYLEVLQKIKAGGKYIVWSKQKLPDGTELILYRNKDWMP